MLAFNASFSTVSGPVSQSFRIAFQLSVTVLVRYRYPADISQVLEGVYLPLQAVIPDSPTRRARSSPVHAHAAGRTLGCHDLRRAFPDHFCLRCTIGREHSTQPTTRRRRCRGADSKVGLSPVHSPLLRRSQLLSFPPRIEMLQFRGFAGRSTE